VLKPSVVGHKEPPAGGAERSESVRWALASLSLSMLLSALGTSIANVGLPTLALAFGAPFQTVQWIILAYLLASTTLIVSVGRLGDVTGRRRLLLAGIATFSVASFSCGLAPTLSLLVAARAAQGIGSAVMMALSMSFVAETVPKSRTGSVIGLLGTMSAIGTALGPSLGGLLIDGLGWRAIFFVSCPLGLVTFILAYRYLPFDRRVPSLTEPKFDKLGTVLLALTLGAYALATTIGARGSFGLLNLALLLAAGCGLAAFVLAEARVTSPLIRLAMFEDLGLSASLAMNALVCTVMMATLVVGPFYLSAGLGLQPMFVGLALSAGSVVVSQIASAQNERRSLGSLEWRLAAWLSASCQQGSACPATSSPSRSSPPIMRCSRPLTAQPSWRKWRLINVASSPGYSISLAISASSPARL
jgi:MFS family permease